MIIDHLHEVSQGKGSFVPGFVRHCETHQTKWNSGQPVGSILNLSSLPCRVYLKFKVLSQYRS